MFKNLVFALAVAACTFWGAAGAADKPQYAPAAPWVKAVPIPNQPTPANGAATQLLLENLQDHFGLDGDEFYGEYATKVLTPQGLSDTGNIILSWDPAVDSLIIHKLDIIRDGKVIDQLDGGKAVTVLRRETNLEMAMLDGTLTATVQLSGLQVGDIVDVASTIITRDPVLKNHSVGFAGLDRSGVIGRFYMRATWPRSKMVRWRAANGLPKPQVGQTAEGTELLIDQTNAEAPKPPAYAPYRYKILAEAEFSQFASWSELSALMAPLYGKAATLAPDSPLKAEIKTIAAASNDPKTRASAALKLVEDKIRYLDLAMDDGGYVPADADQTWSRRFGDCKGKTVLLLALLHGLGVEAEPALVNTERGDGMDQRLPELLFNHVIVRARIAGRTYWLDGTRQGDGDLDHLPIPNYHWALPVAASGSTLEKLNPPPYDEPHFESIVRLDARAGLDAPAPAHVERIFRGDDGLDANANLTDQSRSETDRIMRDYWRKKISWISPKTVSFTYDPATVTTTMIMDGTASIDWAKGDGFRDFDIADSSLGYQANFEREPGLEQDAPFAVDYPSFNKWTVVVQLPNKGVGFRLLNQSEDKTVAGVRYKRESNLSADGVATFTAIDQAMAPEFPASEAKAAALALADMAQYDGAIRYDLRALAKQCLSEDADAALAACTVLIGDPSQSKEGLAADYAARGVAHRRKKELDLALGDLNQAISLNPRSYDAIYARAVVEFTQQDFGSALRDMEAVDQIKPGFPGPPIIRSQIYIIQGKLDQALKEAEQAVQLGPNIAASYRQRLRVHEKLAQWDPAIADADKVAQLTPNNAAAVNGQCWTRAEANKDLDVALSFCEAALKLAPNSAAITDSRAFVQFRKGQMKEALADYDQALKLNAKQSSSLFMRGVVERRLGDLADGDADLAAAKAVAPTVADAYAAIGVTP